MPKNTATSYMGGNVSIVAIGKKAQEYYQRRKYNVIGNNNDVYLDLNFQNVSKITESIMDGFLKGQYDRVELVYNQFRNAAVQILVAEQLLPVPKPEKPAEKDKTTTQVDYILEPSQEEIVAELIPKNIKIQLYKAVLDSHASEHGARMTAMDKATDNAGELLKALKTIIQPGTPGSHHHRAYRNCERCSSFNRRISLIKVLKKG